MNTINSENPRPNEEGKEQPLVNEKGGKESVPVKKESAVGRFFRLALRWTLGILIVFGLGFLTVIYFWVLPLRQTNAQNMKDLAAAQDKIAQLEQQLADQTVLQKNYQQEITQLKTSDYQFQIKLAQLEIANAQIALYQNDPSKGLSALDHVATVLSDLSKQLPQEHQAKITDLQTRLELAKNEVKDNTYAARSDLDVLSQGLEQLAKDISLP